MTSEKNPLSKKTGTLQIRSLHDIPELYSNNRTKNPVAYARFQAPWLKKSWYVFEWSRKDSFFGLEANEVTGRRLYGFEVPPKISSI